MKKDFNYWKNLYDSNNLVEFNSDSTGQLWLKIKSITRRELICEFTDKYSISLKTKRINEQFKELFSLLQDNLSISHDRLDLYIKVTYFPSEYLKLKRREKGFPVELTFLKSKARELSIDFDKTASPSDIYYEIIEKLKDRNNKTSLDVLNQLKSENIGIVNEAQQHPKLLAKWLYENQGEMRFGPENRLFLILVDTDDFSNSWKLKRNLELLTPIISTFLKTFSSKKIPDLQVYFNYHGKAQTFTVLTDVIFVVR